MAAYRGILRTNLINDQQIRPTEYTRWEQAHRRFATRAKDVKTMDWLRESVPGDGLPEPILIGVSARYPDVYVADGHHRAVVLRELGIREFPFHWCYIGGADVRKRSEPFPFHLLNT